MASHLKVEGFYDGDVMRGVNVIGRLVWGGESCLEYLLEVSGQL